MTDREPAVGRETLVDALRADLALAAENAYTTTCEGCGAPILQHEDACHYGDVAGCWPYVTGDKAPGPCWRYRTADGMDRAWPECALAPAGRAALSGAGTGGATPPSTWDGGEAGEGRDGTGIVGVTAPWTK